jgi:hypothetical protein
MRISLADSRSRGFKKWSDAQEAKLPQTEIGQLAESAEPRRATATVAGEGRGDDNS